MDESPENLSICPVLIDTKTSGFEADPVEVLEQSLEFRFFEGRETVHAFPHTTGWRVLPFSVFTCILHYGGVIQMEGHPEVPLGAGEAFLIPTGIRHKSDALGVEGVRARWLHFTFRLLGGLDLFSLLDPPGRIPPEHVEEGRAALTEVIDRYTISSGNPLTRMAQRRQAVSRFLVFLLEVCPPRPDLAERVAGSQRLQPALVQIHEHYSDPLGRDELAQLTNLSRSHFHSLFHHLTGMGPMAYLKHRRLQAAQVLLLTTDQPVREIAAAVGYHDPFHFTRLFTVAVGCSPRDFRHRNAAPLQ